ncbi:hypothetical protein BH24CHL9_BH24CHL9_03390 [soil metagenome]
MSNVVGERHQITIGKQVREQLGIRPGDLAVEWVEEGRPINEIRVIELRTDPRYGGFFEHQPASARAELEAIEPGRIRVVVRHFMSRSIVERLRGHEGVLSPRIEAWRRWSIA